MALVNAKDLLQHALQNKYAVGYFESWNLETTYAVIRAAEIARSPVMIGFCGTYLENPDRKYKEDLNLHASILKEVARNASVPVATLLNETDNINMVYRAIRAGFDMVMFVDDDMPVEQLADTQRKIVEFAHACGVAVEAEVGSLPTADNKTGEINSGNNTDPEVAARFVQDTGVDALAVAVGNIHLLEGRKAELDMALLGRLHKSVNIPLVLHGGTGIDKACFREAVEMGIAKVNVGAGLKRTVINAEKKYFLENNVELMNPNDILGKGGRYDIAIHSHDALIEEVLEYIRAFNGENKAM